jgi:hypothetical protein
MRECEHLELEIQQLREKMRESGVDFEEQVQSGNRL